jgi:hypothetical protein
MRVGLAASILALLAFAACSSSPGVNVVNNNMGPRAAADAAAAAPSRSNTPVTKFDGEWALSFTANPSRAQQCPSAPSREVPLTVEQGRATLQMGKTYTGLVNEGGEARIADRMDRTIAILGSFQGERFVGEFRNGTCSYAVAGKKR